MYSISPKPTVYGGIKFRSRLEAKWAAFFDLNNFQWDYEPVDLLGWTPDFVIHTKWCDVFAEVKPVFINDEIYPPKYREECYYKARRHWKDIQVLLLGLSPSYCSIGCLTDPPNGSDYLWADVENFLLPNIEIGKRLFIEASNIVQWLPKE